MRTSEEIYHRVRWDPRFDPARFVLGVDQRGAAPKRVPLPAFVPGGDIPWHRVLFIEADGELVWDRADGTGPDRLLATRAGYGDPRRLRAPFFTARTPYAWDPAAGLAARARRHGRGGRVRRRGRARADLEHPVGPLRQRPHRHRAGAGRCCWRRCETPTPTSSRCRRSRPGCSRMLLRRALGPRRLHAGHRPGGQRRRRQRAAAAQPAARTGGRACTSSARTRRSPPSPWRPPPGRSWSAATHLTSDHTDDGAARREAELAGSPRGWPASTATWSCSATSTTAATAPPTRTRAAGRLDRGARARTTGRRPSTRAVNPLAAVSSLSGRASRLDRVLLRAAGAAGRRPRPCAATPPTRTACTSPTTTASRRTSPSAGTRARRGARTCAPTARTAVAWIPPRGAVAGDPGDPPGRTIRRSTAGRRTSTCCSASCRSPTFERAAPLLAAAAAETPPFTARLEGVRTFRHREDATVWLDPAAAGDDAVGRAAPRAGARVPALRGPRRGLHAAPDPGPDPGPRTARRRLRRAARRRDGRVGELVLLSRRGDEPMRPRATIALGTGEVRWLTRDAPGAHRPGARPRHARTRTPIPRTARRRRRQPHGRGRPQVVGAGCGGAAADGVVHVVGSRRMGCALPGADLDLVAALPGTVDPADVRARVTAALPEADRAAAGDRRPGAGPAAAACAAWTSTWCVVATGAVAPAEAVARRAELGEAAAIALSAVSDADAVLRGGRRAPRRVRPAGPAGEGVGEGAGPGLGAVRRPARPGLDGTGGAYGPRGRRPVPTGDLLRHFFGTWAAWDWREPVALRTARPRHAGPGSRRRLCRS